MKTLRRLALTADLVAMATVMLGSWTRINGAGMTCPSWPLCHGRLIPSMSDGTIWEWSHRLFAFLVAPLVVAVVIAAWRQRHRSRFIAPVIAAIALLFMVQVGLGAATVALGNSPFSVVLHWGTAMLFVASLTALVVFTANAEQPQPPAIERAETITAGMLAGCTLVAFATMCVGAYVSSSGAGLACLSIPGCAGNVVVAGDGQFVQMLHRFCAAATLLCAAGAFGLSWARPASGRVRTAVSIGLGLVCVQVVLGLLNVALRLPIDLREAHAFNAALLFLAFVVATLLALLDATGAALHRVTAES